MHDPTVPGGLVGFLHFFGFLFLFVFLFNSHPANAQSPVLRDVEVRSFLGEPLNLRIALAASTEPYTSAICQSVIDGDRRENSLRGSDLVLTMVELRDTRYLQVRSRAVYNEPVARFALRIGCPGEPIVDREFTVLIDPPPFTALPVMSPAPDAALAASIPYIPAKSAKPPARAKAVVPASGTWSVHEGDTLAWLARGIHPKNRARQRQYIAALRVLNPQLADIADDAALTPGTKLALPDLLTLSGIMPRAAVVTPPSAPAAAKKTPAAKKPVTRAAPQIVPKPPAAAPPAAIPAVPKATTPAATKPTPTAAKPEPAKPAPGVKAAPRADGFQLRLSGSEMDLSRSRNVTDEQRQRLREKQLMLDADDQVSALLSLKNTVKQLEQRLNEMQLKLAATPSTRPTPPLPPASALSTPAAPTPSAPSTAAPAQKLPAATVPAPTAAAPAAAPAPATTPAQAPDKAPSIVAAAPPVIPAPAKSAPVSAPLEKPAPPEPLYADTIAGYLPSPLVTGGIVAVMLALAAAWAWSRRDSKSKKYLDSVMPGAPGIDATPADATRRKSTRVATRDSAGLQVDDGPASEPPVSEAFMRTPRNVANEMNKVARADAVADPVVNETRAASHHPVDAPVVFDDTPARYEVDSRPATTVDFLVGMDEKLPEDRVRRLQYMHERYPELKSNTVSIDDADSVINAARLYYDDYVGAGKSTNRDKASELLTFAVEERPQEMRFWLAQFEIFRLENMVAEFTAMAGKFHVLFSHTTAWPKVRHIGHELDPGNPLFAAGGSPLLAGETRFDPIAENWLNAPMDFTSDALMSDLRLAMLDDHGVSRGDFESITARLSATARAGAA